MFSKKEKQLLLAVPYVWEKVISRLEEVWYDSFAALSEVETESLLELLSGYLNSTCYKNSPQARKSISWAIECAKKYTI